MRLGNIKSILQITHSIRTGEFLIVDQVRSMLVNNGVERKSVSPGGGKVTDIDVVVARGLHLAPEQQSVLGTSRFFIFAFFDRDVLNLEPAERNRNKKKC